MNLVEGEPAVEVDPVVAEAFAAAVRAMAAELRKREAEGRGRSLAFTEHEHFAIVRVDEEHSSLLRIQLKFGEAVSTERLKAKIAEAKAHPERFPE